MKFLYYFKRKTNIDSIVKKYMDAGVLRDKITVTKQPSVCVYSITRKCIVGENGNSILEIIPNGDGNFRASYENNRRVSLLCRSTINADEINNSNGIIVTDATYGKPVFRFGFIPII